MPTSHVPGNVQTMYKVALRKTETKLPGLLGQQLFAILISAFFQHFENLIGGGCRVRDSHRASAADQAPDRKRAERERPLLPSHSHRLLTQFTCKLDSKILSCALGGLYLASRSFSFPTWLNGPLDRRGDEQRAHQRRQSPLQPARQQAIPRFVLACARFSCNLP